MKPFCEPETHASTPHSPMRMSSEPTDDTPSTNSSAGCLAASSALRTPAMSEETPVAVSLCVANTALISWFLSLARMSAYFSSGTPVPHSSSQSSTLRPRRSAMSTQSSENWPKRLISTLSPTASVLVIADSQAPVPEDGKMNTRPSFILKTFFRSSKIGNVNFGNSGLRISSMGRFMAMRTASGMFVGPGMKRCGFTILVMSVSSSVSSYEWKLSFETAT